MIYLDWASAAVPDNDIANEAHRICGSNFGNPSSEHRMGIEAQEILTESRKIWASALGCSPANLLFCSGGTEGNNLVLQHLLLYKNPPHTVMTGIEHASIYEPLSAYKEQGTQLTIVSPVGTGHLSAESIAEAVQPNTRFISIIAVHNETGSVQPLQEIITAVREREKTHKYKIHIHIDAVQALGKIPFRCDTLQIDSAVFSSHKIRGPKGTGVLYLKNPVRTLTSGGEQEFSIRPGTENTYSIYGSALAVEKAVKTLETNYSHAQDLMTLLLQLVSEKGLGQPFYSEVSSSYSPFINILFFPPVPGEAVVRALSDTGVAVGTGSACSKQKDKRSRGLKSMGLKKEKYDSAIRISTGYTTTKKDIITLVKAIEQSIIPLVKLLKNNYK